MSEDEVARLAALLHDVTHGYEDKHFIGPDGHYCERWAVRLIAAGVRLPGVPEGAASDLDSAAYGGWLQGWDDALRAAREAVAAGEPWESLASPGDARAHLAADAAMHPVPSPEPLDVALITIRRAQGEAIVHLLEEAARGVVFGPTGRSLASNMATKVAARLAAPQPVPEYPPILATNKTTSGWGPAAPQPVPEDES